MLTTELLAPLERRFVGTVYADLRRCLPAAVELVSPGDIADPIARDVYGLLVSALAEGSAWDDQTRILMRIGQRLEDGAVAAVLGWADDPGNISHLAEHIQTDVRRREVDALLREATSAVADPDQMPSEVVEAVTGRLLGVLAEDEGQDDAIASAGEEALDALTERSQRDGSLIGWPTGLAELDELTGGLQRGHFGVLAADTGVGKSAVLAGMVGATCAAGGRVGVFSLEMTRAEYADRLIRLIADVSADGYQSGSLPDEDMSEVMLAADLVMGWPLRIDHRAGLHVAQISAKARRWAVRHPIDLIVVDYLQLVRGDGRNREREIASVSATLKGLAKDLRCCVVIGSQVNNKREQQGYRPYRVSDLRESTAPAHDADWVVFIDREGARVDEDGQVMDRGQKRPVERGAAQLQAPKVRGRRPGSRPIRWDTRRACYTSGGLYYDPAAGHEVTR